MRQSIQNDTNIVYPELSYKLVGLAFEIYNELGPGYQEKYYQRAYEIALQENALDFKREEFVPLTYKGNDIGRYFIDFVVDEKIVVEFKVGSSVRRGDIRQVFGYLKSKNLKLGIIVVVKSDGVTYKRIVNIRKD